MKKINFIPYLIFIIVTISLLIAGSVRGQGDANSISKLLIEKDSAFWSGYNSCNITLMDQYMADDVEFYHDKGGVMIGVEKFNDAMRKNICGNASTRIRREAISSTFKVYPMKDGDNVYGAILSGDHYFYSSKQGEKESRDGLAKFTHLWLLKDNVWKMHRILSYDHGPVPYLNARHQIKLTEKLLNQYAGLYQATQAGQCIVQREGDHLILMIGKEKYILYPESATSFFVKERDLVFEYTKSDKGQVTKFSVIEKGKVVEVASRT